ncbi:CHAT domain-containing tetratricopeptide repeat protein [Rhizorhabdus sp. FW153]|uniref:CHAT domain-containing tetratricopeptide repeat protein n=1 Tax=Rhizorhabdus sp. FW153 TaxID=3400216 RepID=UPI003CF54168
MGKIIMGTAVLAGLLACGPVTAASPSFLTRAESIDTAADPGGAVIAWQNVLATTPAGARARARALLGLGEALVTASRSDEAIPILEQVERASDARPEQRARAMTLLGSALADANRLDDAKAKLAGAIGAWRGMSPQGGGQEAIALNILATVHFAAGDLAEAERVGVQSIELYRRSGAPEDAELVGFIGNMSTITLQARKLEASEAYAREAMTLAGRILPEDHPTAIVALTNWVAVLAAQNRREESVDILKRIAALREKRFGPDYPPLAITYNNLARNLLFLGRAAEGEPYARRAVAIGEKTRDPADQVLAAFRDNLADQLVDLGREAESVEIRRGAIAGLGNGNQQRAMRLRSSLGKTLLKMGDDEGARQQFDLVDQWQARTLPDTHPDRIEIRSYGVLLAAKLGKPDAKARLTALSADVERELFANADPDRRASSVADLLARLLDASWLTGDRATGFRIAQLMALDEAGRAIYAVSTRTAARVPEAAVLVRRRQDLLAERDRSTQAALRAYGKGDADYREATAAVAKVDAALVETETALRSLSPADTALTRFQSLDEKSVAARLDGKEALLMPVPLGKDILTFVVRRDRADWARSEASTVLADISAMRSSLNVDLSARGALADQAAARPAFDRALAYRIYRAIIAERLEKALAGSQSWIVAPGGPLAALPFAALVTRSPEGKDGEAATLRRTAWLIRRAALTQIPAVSGLGTETLSTKPGERFVGIGAPLLDGKAAPGEVRSFYRGGVINRDAIAALAPLPQAERELNRMRDALRLQPALLVGAAATEAAVKRQDLRNVRVLAFATHGLVAGAVDRNSEPGLVLTPPDRPDATDDGLLTASEIAALDIDADWVVLSACNTAAGSSTSAPALSGLARAFLYAGGRSLLVSHWAVRDDVAARLTVETAQQARHGRSRAEALRRAMLDLIDDRSQADGADPSLWAPFILVATR